MSVDIRTQEKRCAPEFDTEDQCDMKTDCNSYDRVYFPPFTT